jgi:DNA repair exonuclease SbcCD ATPase subunit
MVKEKDKDEIKYIFHISDIHIMERNYKNLESSFDKLVQAICTAGINKSMLVIAGDVFEEKKSLKPHDIERWFDMCEKLELNEIKTLVMCGNHDYNINSDEKLDSVTLLTNRFNYKNIIGVNSTQIVDGGVFGYSNIDFYMFSPIDKKIPGINPDRADKIKIAVLHESVNNAKYDTGRVTKDERFTANDLALYDYVLLGDIHKHQFLGDTGRIAYCGSFVQKKVDESIEKGYILWDLEKEEGIFTSIQLPEIYIKMEAINNTCNIPDIKDDQTVRMVSIVYKECTEEWIKDIQDIIKKKYGDKLKNTNISIKPDDSAPVINHISSDIVPTDTHHEIIREILGDDPIVNRIIKDHGKLIQDQNMNTKIKYRLKYLYWSNIYCYGEDNYINFADFEQTLVMLNGKNKSGKSAVLDILILILFNKCTRGAKENVVSNGKKSGFIKVSFIVGSDEYIIEQTYFKESNNRPHMLYINNKMCSDISNISKNGYKETYEYLHKEVGLGNYENFINMAVATQDRSSFVDMKQANLTKLLINITNVDVLEGIENTMNSRLKEIKSKYSSYKEDLNRIKEVSDDELNECKNIEHGLKEKQTEIENEITKITNEMNRLYMDYNNEPIPIDLAERIRESDDKLAKCLQNGVLSYYTEMSIAEVNSELGKIHGKLSNITDKEIAFIRANSFPISNDDVDNKDILNQKIEELNKKGVYHPPEITFRNIENLNTIVSNYKEEPLLPVDDCKIHSLKVLDPNHLDESLTSLPNYTAIRKEVNAIEANIENYNSNFKKLVYNANCESCKSNQCNVRNIFDIDANITRLALLKQELNNEAILSQRYHLSEKYKADKILNELFIKREKAIAVNIGIEARKAEFISAEKELREYDNKILWDQLQKYKKKAKYYQYAIIKVCLNNQDNLMKVQKYLDIKKDNDSLHNSKKIELSNNNIQVRIGKLEKMKLSKTREFKEVGQELDKIKEKYFMDSQNAKTRKELLEKFVKIEEEYNYLTKYLKAIDCKTGIPTRVLKTICQKLERNCNKILSEITDFTVVLKYEQYQDTKKDWKHKISIFTECDGNVNIVDMASGMQKFVLDLAFRISLLEITSLSNPEILFIDEGFGCLDEDNFGKVANVLQRFKNNFNAIVIISHIGTLNFYSDISMHVTKDNTISKLVYGKLESNDKKVRILNVLTESGKATKEHKKYVAQEKKNNAAAATELVGENMAATEPVEDDALNQYIKDRKDMNLLFRVNDKYCLCCKKVFTRFDSEKKFLEHYNRASIKDKHNKFINKLPK